MSGGRQVFAHGTRSLSGPATLREPEGDPGDRLRAGSLYRLLADHGLTLFPNDYFADLYVDSVRGQPTIPARVMATVMLLQAYEGLSDAEATDRLEGDLRWQAACGVDTGYVAFHPTSLVGQRNRLRAVIRKLLVVLAAPGRSISPRRSGPHFREMTNKTLPASPRATGTTSRQENSSSTSSCGTALPHFRSSKAKS